MALANPSRRFFRVVAVAGVTTTLAALALPAGAASSARPAKGAATSSLTLIRLTVNGTMLTAGEIAAVAGNTTSPHLAKLVITPVDSTLTGPVGQQTITPSSGTTTVPQAPKSVSLPAGLASLTGPTLSAGASDATGKILASASLKALGKLTVLTVPLNLQAAALSDVAQVTKSGAVAEKAVSLGKLALPSVSDLLAALGVKLPALVDQLTQGKLTQLAGLVGGSVSSLNAAVDSAQAAIGSGAPNTLSAADAALGTATAAQSAAQTAFNAPWAGLSALSLAAIPGAPTTEPSAAAYLALSSTVRNAIQALPGASSLTTLAQGVVGAQSVVTQVNALVDALQALVNQVLSLVTGDTDPLASLGSISITTKAAASRTMSAVADVNVGSVHVLGTKLPLASLTSTLAGVTKTLSSVLNSVTGVSFTAPTISVGTPFRQTHRQGATRFASASITGLTLTLPSITLPAALAVAGVPHGVSGALTLGELAETAQYTPAKAATPTTPKSGHPTSNGHPTSSGHLADTGGHVWLPIAGLVVLAGGLALRRRFGSA